ncbi:MAG: hypothetical protein ACRCY3_13890 [Sphingorhabdus sp.]
MRLLLYLLALLTGFSAAEAARPVETTSPSSTASPVELADAVATTIVIDADTPKPSTVEMVTMSGNEAVVAWLVDIFPISSPVLRADLLQE